MNENKFANDGSFLELFKKKMEEEQAKKQRVEPDESIPHSDTTYEASPGKSGDGHQATDDACSSVCDSGSSTDCTPDCSNEVRDSEKLSSGLSTQKKPVSYPLVGKRRGRGAPVLKTGAVKKQKKEDEEQDAHAKKDAWSQYMAEVKKYKEQSCQDEDKTRPLVK